MVGRLFDQVNPTPRNPSPAARRSLSGVSDRGAALKNKPSLIKIFFGLLMAPHPRIAKAFSAMDAMGISAETVKPVLKHLLKLYDRKWELIEEDNYRTLADAIFECADEKLRKEKAVISHDEPEPPSKRQNLTEHADQISSTRDNGSITLPLEEGETHQTFSPQKLMESSQSSLRNRRREANPDAHQASIVEKGKEPMSSNMDPMDRKLASQGASCVIYSDRVLDATSVSNMQRQRVEKDDQHEVIKPRNKQSLNEIPDFSVPTHCGSSNSLSLLPGQQPRSAFDKKTSIHMMSDITKGTEKVRISLMDEIGNEHLPSFVYIPRNIVYQNAYVHVALARIADEDCCPSCIGDCLSSSVPCACARDTGGEFAYTPQGLLKEEFLRVCIAMNIEPQKHHLLYCQDCPLERAKNVYNPEPCKGHVLKKFIKECWSKCGCSMQCGNRVVQRGISCSLQVFLTDGKGWGLRTVEDLPGGTFVCEYVGEILTNIELYERNKRNRRNERHTYPVLLDADWGSEQVLKDEDALCLDATYYGNVARFINHRCFDANLLEIPVEVENPDHHYYHLAFFTKTHVKAFEELTWDYRIDFDDHNHPIKAFQCCCASLHCRDSKQKEMAPKQLNAIQNAKNRSRSN